MKTQEQIDEMTEARTARGREMEGESGQGAWLLKSDPARRKISTEFVPSMDWAYHHDRRQNLSSSERATFDLEFIKARGKAGVRASVDLALAEMREKLMHRLGKPTWRAG